MGNINFSYKGKIRLAHKVGDRIISKREIHNAGLPDMSQLFAKAVAGVWDASEDAPRLLDIGYIVESSDAYVETERLSIWQSILNNPVNIGGRQYSYNEDEKNWIATLTSTVLYSDLNGAILDKVLQNANDGKIQLQIRLCSYPEDARKYFAKVDVTPADISQIKDTTSAIVTWICELVRMDDGEYYKGNVI